MRDFPIIETLIGIAIVAILGLVIYDAVWIHNHCERTGRNEPYTAYHEVTVGKQTIMMPYTAYRYEYACDSGEKIIWR